MIYFVIDEDNQFVKIGHTQDFERRMINLQNGNPKTLSLVKSLDGGQQLEQIIHKVFAPYRNRGEWFRCEGELKEYLFNDKPIDFIREIISIEMFRYLDNCCPDHKKLSNYYSSICPTVEQIAVCKHYKGYSRSLNSSIIYVVFVNLLGHSICCYSGFTKHIGLRIANEIVNKLNEIKVRYPRALFSEKYFMYDPILVEPS